MEREHLVIRTFVELADNLVADFDIVDVLTTLATNSVRLLAVDAAGILLPDERDTLRVVAASREDSALLTLLELVAQQGPAFDCYQSGTSQVSGDLRASAAPELVAAATAQGLHVVHARPMRLRQDVIGVLGLAARSTSVLDDADQALAQALADAATISVLQLRALRDARALTDQLRQALTSRIAIEQAKGVLCERWQTTMDDAFGLLRAHARSTNQRLSDVAHQVTRGQLDSVLAPPEG